MKDELKIALYLLIAWRVIPTRASLCNTARELRLASTPLLI